MNSCLKWFRKVTWLGVLVNLSLGFFSLFYPKVLINTLGGGRSDLFEGPWLGNTGLFSIVIAIFYIPAARDPVRYSLYARLSVFSRLFAGCYWVLYLWLVAIDLPGSFRMIPLTDLTLGIVLGLLLRHGLAQAGESSGR